MGKVTVITSGKGGTGKSTVTAGLGAALVRRGNRVLVIDCDAGMRGIDLMLGVSGELVFDIADIVGGNCPPSSAIYPCKTVPELYILPAPQNVRDKVSPYIMRQLVRVLVKYYDHILIDCMPSLGMLCINALTAADSVIIPTQASYLSTKGLSLLLGSIARVRRQINPALKVDGVLLTMVDQRTNNARAITAALRATANQLPVFETEIPFSVRAAETALEGKSIYAHDAKGKVAAAYAALAKEVMAHEQQEPHRPRSDQLSR